MTLDEHDANCHKLHQQWCDACAKENQNLDGEAHAAQQEAFVEWQEAVAARGEARAKQMTINGHLFQPTQGDQKWVR